jgi:hypothetical protein
MAYNLQTQAEIDILKNVLDNIKFKLNSIEQDLHKRAERASDYFKYLREEISIATESALIEINKLSQIYMSEIDNYESECLKFHSENSSLFDQIQNNLNASKAQCDDCSSLMCKNDYELSKIKEKTTNMLQNLDLSELKLKELTFGKYVPYFVSNVDITNDLLGSISNEYWGFSDFSKLKKIDLRLRLPEIDELKEVKYTNDSYLISYADQQHTSFVAKFDMNLTLIVKYEIPCFVKNYKLADYADKVVLYFEHKKSKNSLSIMDKDMRKQTRIARLLEKLKDLAANEKNIFCLFRSYLGVYNERLQMIKKIESLEMSINSLINSNTLRAFLINDRLYIVEKESIAILDERSLQLTCRIPIEATSRVEFNGFLFAVYAENLIQFVNLDGNKWSFEMLNYPKYIGQFTFKSPREIIFSRNMNDFQYRSLIYQS